MAEINLSLEAEEKEKNKALDLLSQREEEKRELDRRNHSLDSQSHQLKELLELKKIDNQKELASLKERIETEYKEAEESLSGKRLENEDLEEKLISLKAEFMDVKNKDAEKIQKLNKLKEDEDNISDAIHEKQLEYEKVKREIALLKQKEESISEEIKEYEKENETLAKRKESLDEIVEKQIETKEKIMQNIKKHEERKKSYAFDVDVVNFKESQHHLLDDLLIDK